MPKSIQSPSVAHLLKVMASLERFRQAELKAFARLTPREREVLVLVAEGLPNPEIAKTLGVTRATVQNHRAGIRQKLNIDSDADYIKYALAFDLTTL